MKNNYCLILCGGIGRRFWPLSNMNVPKQFIDLMGSGESMLQMTYRRYAAWFDPENIILISNEAFAPLLQEQLPQVPASQLLLEPKRCNTAAAITWASYHIRALNPEANIVVAPSDHIIFQEKAFGQALLHGLEFVANEPALLTLGVKPHRPEVGYGYLQMDDESKGEMIAVKTFIEKPTADLAKVFVESGEFLWNSGIFIWNVNTIIKAIEQFLPDMALRFEGAREIYGTNQERAFIHNNYASCSTISIDFGVMEKAHNVYVLCADFGWSDLGTWGGLYEQKQADIEGNVILSGDTLLYEATNNMIAVSPDKLAVIRGLDDYIVAENNRVILVCRKSDEQLIRQFGIDAKLAFGGKYN